MCGYTIKNNELLCLNIQHSCKKKTILTKTTVRRRKNVLKVELCTDPHRRKQILPSYLLHTSCSASCWALSFSSSSANSPSSTHNLVRWLRARSASRWYLVRKFYLNFILFFVIPTHELQIVGSMVYVPPGLTFDFIQLAAIRTVTLINLGGHVAEPCKTYGIQMTCATFLRPCFVTPDNGTFYFVWVHTAQTCINS